MHIYKNVLVIISIFISSIVFAENPAHMKPIAVWAGPFDGTEITKYADFSEGVACYVYSPKSIGYSMNCDSRIGMNCAKHFNGDIGSISCVKVTNIPKKK